MFDSVPSGETTTSSALSTGCAGTVEEVELGAGLIDDLPRGRILITKGSNGLGFNIRGGIDAPYVKADKGIFVVKIHREGAAFNDGRLRVGDKILTINGLKMAGLRHEEVVAHFLATGDVVDLEIVQGAGPVLKEFEALYQTSVREDSSCSEKSISPETHRNCLRNSSHSSPAPVCTSSPTPVCTSSPAPVQRTGVGAVAHASAEPRNVPTNSVIADVDASRDDDQGLESETRLADASVDLSLNGKSNGTDSRHHTADGDDPTRARAEHRPEFETVTGLNGCLGNSAEADGAEADGADGAEADAASETASSLDAEDGDVEVDSLAGKSVNENPWEAAPESAFKDDDDFDVSEVLLVVPGLGDADAISSDPCDPSGEKLREDGVVDDELQASGRKTKFLMSDSSHFVVALPSSLKEATEEVKNPENSFEFRGFGEESLKKGQEEGCRDEAVKEQADVNEESQQKVRNRCSTTATETDPRTYQVLQEDPSAASSEDLQDAAPVSSEAVAEWQENKEDSAEEGILVNPSAPQVEAADDEDRQHRFSQGGGGNLAGEIEEQAAKGALINPSGALVNLSASQVEGADEAQLHQTFKTGEIEEHATKEGALLNLSASQIEAANVIEAMRQYRSSEGGDIEEHDTKVNPSASQIEAANVMEAMRQYRSSESRKIEEDVAKGKAPVNLSVSQVEATEEGRQHRSARIQIASLPENKTKEIPSSSSSKSASIAGVFAVALLIGFAVWKLKR